jgi:hypothetical protein
VIEGATGKFLLQQTAAVSELEAGMISARAKAALAAAKCRGVKLGGDRGARLTAQAQAAGRAAVQERSAPFYLAGHVEFASAYSAGGRVALQTPTDAVVQRAHGAAL